jgi:chitinase
LAEQVDCILLVVANSLFMRVLSALLIYWTMMPIPAAAQPGGFAVIGYFAGSLKEVDNVAAGRLTHVIYSFCHLKGNELSVDNATAAAVIRKLVRLKRVNPRLKVLVSLGGWGGCPTCSEVFSTDANRKAFALSVKKLSVLYGTDGIDLDWEYPTIEGYPGHAYNPADKENFTLLVQELRSTLGNKYEISFAAGGFNKYLDESVDWKQVMESVDRVNIMTYDLVNGYSPVTGHHTPLYSTTLQAESTDNAVTRLATMGVPKNKMVIGAAFYGRVWENVPPENNGLYQKGKFKTSIAYRDFPSKFLKDTSFAYHWDEQAMAPFLYNRRQQLFVSYDDVRSMEAKTKYVRDKGLSGIMFWELTNDARKNGLLETINSVRLRK